MDLNSIFLEKLEKIEQNYDLTFNGKNIVVAVSTGVDSSSLLDLLIKNIEKYKYNIIIAHVNHGKRAQSEIEQKYIESYATEKKINIEVLKLTDNDFSGSNFQEEARNKRIEFFKKVLEKYNTKYLFLAHQLNDEAETIIMHLMRNSSLEGILGMNEVSINKGIYFIRPLIDIKKDDLYDYAKLNNVKYFEDYTNQSDNYTRNQVRHNLIDKTYKNMSEAIKSYKDNINEAVRIINKNRDELINKCFNIDNEIIKINYSYFCNLSEYEKIDCLFEVLKKYDYSRANIEEIIKIFKKAGNIKVEYKDILILKEYNEIEISKNTISLEQFKEVLIDSEGHFDIDSNHYIEVRKLKIDESNEKTLDFDISNKDIICYNQSMMPFIIRNKLDGDRIKIKNGTKKVNELLVDLKVPLSKREKVKVLVDKNGDIISVLGIRKSFILNEMSEKKVIKNLLIKSNYYNNI